MNPNVSAHPSAVSDRPASWSGVFALALSAFVLVASEFMPVSLLTQVAAGLNVTEGRAGQSIAVSGVFALVTSLLISSLARSLDRKKLLLGLTLLMVVSGTIAAFSPNYTMFMLARAFIGVAIGGFWSMSAAVAMRLVPTDQVPKALAIVNGGNALATVVAAPLGSFLGAIVGWRGTFFFLIPVALVALAWKLISLPAMPTGSAGRRNSLLSLLRRRPVVLGMAAVSVFFMGQFTLFTYLRPFLEAVTRTSASVTSLLLLVIGVAGFAGTILIGRVLKNHLYRTVIMIPVAMAAIALALIGFGDSVTTTAVLLGVWGLLATSAPVGWWTWLARTLPDDAEAGGGLMVAVVQLAIGNGAAVGGLLFDAYGYQATFGASALMLVTGAVLAVFAARAVDRAL
jgi:predicted MFS family arabinose efflux permease